MKCNFCETIGDENTLVFDPRWKYWLCPVCDAKIKAAGAAPEKKPIVEKPVKVIDPVDAELDAQYQEQLMAARERKIAEKIERNSTKKKTFAPKLKDMHANTPVVSRIDGELYCQVCGGKTIKKAGYTYTYEEKIQKYQCSTCGYAFSKYHDNVRIV